MNGALDLSLVFVFSTTQVKSRSGEVAASQKQDMLTQAWAELTIEIGTTPLVRNRN